MSYTIPPATRIGHIHLKVADLERSLKFYRDLLGFEVQQYYGDSAVFISETKPRGTIRRISPGRLFQARHGSTLLRH